MRIVRIWLLLVVVGAISVAPTPRALAQSDVYTLPPQYDRGANSIPYKAPYTSENAGGGGDAGVSTGNVGRSLAEHEYEGTQLGGPTSGGNFQHSYSSGVEQATHTAELMPFRHVEDAPPLETPSEGANPSTSRAADEPLKLAPPSQRRGLEAPEAQTPGGALATVLGSLGVVLGLFFAVVWFTRRALPKAAATLPSEAVEVLGRTPLGARQNMHVIRFGRKLLLVSVTQGGAETLCEIDDAEEVARIAGLCQQSQPGSISQTFRQVLSQFANEPAPGGFLGTDENVEAAATAAPATARNRRNLRSTDV